MTITDPVEARTALVAYLQRQMIGPAGAEDETLIEDPSRRYLTAILYAQEPRSAQTVPLDAADPDATEPELTAELGGYSAADDDQPVDTGVGAFVHQIKPASAGISFFLRRGRDFTVTVAAAQYLPPEQAAAEVVQESLEPDAAPVAEPGAPVNAPSDEGSMRTDEGDTLARGYMRKALGPQAVRCSPPPSRVLRQTVLEGAAILHVLWRPQASGHLVTVTLINAARRDEHSRERPEQCLYQVELACAPDPGSTISVYPHVSLISVDKEDQILNVLYRDDNPFAVGHGCAAYWERPVQGETSRVWLEFMPHHQVPELTFELEDVDPQVLSLTWLGEAAVNEAYIERLRAFVGAYRRWIDALRSSDPGIPEVWNAAVEELLQRLNAAAGRMETGILTLQHHPDVAACFQVANRAMLLQRQFRDPALTDFAWRPFQLAFLLLTLPSVAFENDTDRNIVDLIWFPTGGGKTEAYLTITAFLLFWRRLCHGAAGEGTAVLMRYTLRLLTTQQFQRAAALICACDLLRQADAENRFGETPISIGLWVGQSTTPNSCEQAWQAYEHMVTVDPRAQELFPLTACPCCGTRIIPENENRPDQYGIRASKRDFTYFCPNPDCPFHDALPVQIVDEMLYKQPPSLLIGTVDTFARLPWEEGAGRFFGGTDCRPPELIIQDELHLISGPLGTIVGLYETAVDGLIRWSSTVTPKIIASTATIRRADAQCKALFNREVALFPPSGLEAADSYFARYDFCRPGRLYLGVMAAGRSSQQTQIILSAALLQAPLELVLEDRARDAYWTLVTYHNTLRETGRTHSFINDEIPERQPLFAASEEGVRQVEQDAVVDLTSRGVRNLGETLARLELSAENEDAVSFLACTNMLSVGVDIQRLGLMLMIGQPKTASEYIQATSRVGRGVPGLVVTNYFASRPRDRSHFEQFHGFHAALYRYVEPTSVTPFSPPARERGLHAVLATLIRHQPGVPMAGSGNARDFRASSPVAQRARQLILERIDSVDQSERMASEEQLSQQMREWDDAAQMLAQLDYDSRLAQRAILLLPFEAQKEHDKGTNWRTLNSMRHVDPGSLLRVISVRNRNWNTQESEGDDGAE
jgi:hypothetical protein